MVVVVRMRKPIDECICSRNISFIPSDHDPEECPVALWSNNDKRFQNVGQDYDVLRKVVEYYWEAERMNWVKQGYPKGHIFQDLTRLNRLLLELEDG